MKIATAQVDSIKNTSTRVLHMHMYVCMRPKKIPYTHVRTETAWVHRYNKWICYLYIDSTTISILHKARTKNRSALEGSLRLEDILNLALTCIYSKFPKNNMSILIYIHVCTHVCTYMGDASVTYICTKSV